MLSYFIPHILLPGQNLASTLPTMQLKSQQFGLIFPNQTYLYLLGVHDVDREIEGAKHYIAVSIAIMGRHL